MIIPKVKCVCGCENVYFIEHPNSTNVIGIYCTMCGRWIKWANRNEKRLYEKSIKSDKGGTKYGY